MYKKDHHHYYYYYAMADIIYPRLNFAVRTFAASEIKSRNISYSIKLFRKKINLFQKNYKRQNTIIASWKRPFFQQKHTTKNKETKKMFTSQNIALENLRKFTDPEESLISKLGRAFFDKKPSESNGNNEDNGEVVQNNNQVTIIPNNNQIAIIPSRLTTYPYSYHSSQSVTKVPGFWKYETSQHTCYKEVPGYGKFLAYSHSHSEITINIGCSIL